MVKNSGVDGYKGILCCNGKPVAPNNNRREGEVSRFWPGRREGYWAYDGGCRWTAPRASQGDAHGGMECGSRGHHLRGRKLAARADPLGGVAAPQRELALVPADICSRMGKGVSGIKRRAGEEAGTHHTRGE